MNRTSASSNAEIRSRKSSFKALGLRQCKQLLAQLPHRTSAFINRNAQPEFLVCLGLVCERRRPGEHTNLPIGPRRATLFSRSAHEPQTSRFRSRGCPNESGFRTDSVKIVVWITGAPNHGDYSSLPDRDAAIARLQASGVRVLPILLNPGTELLQQARYLATMTRSAVAPSAWGAPGFRPAGCAPSQCCTLADSVGEAPQAQRNCPLAVSLVASGTGMGAAIINGVQLAYTAP
jgi:hypothetical protein